MIKNKEIRNAFINSVKIRLRLTKDSLRGTDTLLVPTSYFTKRGIMKMELMLLLMNKLKKKCRMKCGEN